MGELGLPTLADARRQVWVRELIAWLLGGLGLIFLLLFLLKFLYLDFGHFPRNQIAGKWQPDEGLIVGAW